MPPPNETELLRLAVDLAARIIDGSNHAGIAVVQGREFSTPVAFDDVARRRDALQYQLHEGPRLDAVRWQETVISRNLSEEARAFYGRCSTEDSQDPETSKAWQLSNAAKFVRPLGGVIVAEFFDIGQSRSVPWERRNAASRLLGELRNRDRGWTGGCRGRHPLLVR